MTACWAVTRKSSSSSSPASGAEQRDEGGTTPAFWSPTATPATFADTDWATLLADSMARDKWDVVLQVLERLTHDDDDDSAAGVAHRAGTALLQSCSSSSVDHPHPRHAHCAHNVLSAMKLANLVPTITDYATTIEILCRSSSSGREEDDDDVPETTTAALTNAKKAPFPAGAPNEAGRNDWWKTALVLRQEAALLLTEQGDLPIATYEALVSCLARAREWRQVVRLVRTMEQANQQSNSHRRRRHNATQPTLGVYRTAIDCCVAARQADLATQLLLSYVETTSTTTADSSSIGSTSSRTIPTTTAMTALFETVVACLCQQLQWRRALTLLETMDRLGLDKSRRLYHALLTACARAREPAQAKALLGRMRQRDQIRPDIESFNAVMAACVGSGLWKDALVVLDQVHREPGVAPDLYTYTNAIRACAKGNLASRALTLLEVIRDKGMKMDAYCYTAAMEACGDWRKALDLLREMNDNGVHPTEVTYSVVIKSCGAGGQWEKALELLDGMRGQGMKPNLFVYNAAITAIAKTAKKRLYLSKGGSNREATSSSTAGKPLLLYREIDRLVRQMEQDQIEPDGFTYTSVISCYGAEGRWAEAMALMDQMQKGGPATRPNRVAYTAAMASCATANQPDAALRLFRQMKEQGVAPDIVAYNALFAALRAGRCSDAAFQLWDEMMGRTNQTNSAKRTVVVTTAKNNIQPDIITLTDAIGAIASNGSFDRVDQVFNEAVELGLILRRDGLDSLWEFDLSGLSFPVARAACRFIVFSLLQRAEKADEDFEDLVFITGVGSRHKHGLVNTTSLREYIQEVLISDFRPGLNSTIPFRAKGTIVIHKNELLSWRRQEHSFTRPLT